MPCAATDLLAAAVVVAIDFTANRSEQRRRNVRMRM